MSVENSRGQRLAWSANKGDLVNIFRQVTEIKDDQSLACVLSLPRTGSKYLHCILLGLSGYYNRILHAHGISDEWMARILKYSSDSNQAALACEKISRILNLRMALKSAKNKYVFINIREPAARAVSNYCLLREKEFLNDDSLLRNDEFVYETMKDNASALTSQSKSWVHKDLRKFALLLDMPDNVQNGFAIAKSKNTTFIVFKLEMMTSIMESTVLPHFSMDSIFENLRKLEWPHVGYDIGKKIFRNSSEDRGLSELNVVAKACLERHDYEFRKILAADPLNRYYMPIEQSEPMPSDAMLQSGI